MNASDQRRRDVEAAIEFLADEPTRITRAYRQHRNNGLGYCSGHTRKVPHPCLTRQLAENAFSRLNRPLIPRPREASA